MHHLGDGADDDDEAADVDLNDWAGDDCDEAVGVKMSKRMTMATTWSRPRGGSSAASHYQHPDCPHPSNFPLKSKRSQMLLPKCPALVPWFSCAFLRSTGFQDRGVQGLSLFAVLRFPWGLGLLALPFSLFAEAPAGAGCFAKRRGAGWRETGGFLAQYACSFRT